MNSNYLTSIFILMMLNSSAWANWEDVPKQSAEAKPVVVKQPVEPKPVVKQPKVPTVAQPKPPIAKETKEVKPTSVSKGTGTSVKPSVTTSSNKVNNGDKAMNGNKIPLLPLEVSKPAVKKILTDEDKAFVFEHAKDFSEGLAVVKKNGKYGVIDKTGKVVVPFKYDNTKEVFSDGLLGVELKGKWGFIDKTGNIIIPIEYDTVDKFSEGLAIVHKNKERYFINKRGEKMIDVSKYQAVVRFSEGLAAFNCDDFAKSYAWGFMDKDGKEVIPCEYGVLGNNLGTHFSNGLVAVRYHVTHDKYQETNGNWGFIDKTGKVVIPFNNLEVENFSEGFAMVRKFGGGFYVINKKGEKIFETDYIFDSFRKFKDEVLVVRKEWLNGAIDTSGNIVIPLKYDFLGNFSEGLARVSKKDNNNKDPYASKEGAIDKSGNLVIPFKYDYLGGFYDGFSMVEKNRKYGYIDKTGKPLVIKE